MLLWRSRLLKKAKGELSAGKKELQSARQALEQGREALAASTAAVQSHERLVKQAIGALVQRLRLQLELLSIAPLATRPTHEPTLASSQQAQPQHANMWRGLHAQWEQLRRELDDSDWQLIHMKNRLEELCFPDSQLSEYGPSMSTSSSSATGDVSSASGFSSTRPFSDAVAAGMETAPVAEQLKASASVRSIAPHSASPATAADLNVDAKGAVGLSVLAKGAYRQLSVYEG